MLENYMSLSDRADAIQREAAFEYAQRGESHHLHDAHLRVLNVPPVVVSTSDILLEAKLTAENNRLGILKPQVELELLPPVQPACE